MSGNSKHTVDDRDFSWLNDMTEPSDAPEALIGLRFESIFFPCDMDEWRFKILILTVIASNDVCHSGLRLKRHLNKTEQPKGGRIRSNCSMRVSCVPLNNTIRPFKSCLRGC